MNDIKVIIDGMVEGDEQTIEGYRTMPTEEEHYVCAMCVTRYSLSLSWCQRFWRHRLLKRPAKDYMTCQGCSDNYQAFLPKWEIIAVSADSTVRGVIASLPEQYSHFRVSVEQVSQMSRGCRVTWL